MADAQPDDIKDLLGGALFKALYKWMLETGPVYLLPTGAPLCGRPAGRGALCVWQPAEELRVWRQRSAEAAEERYAERGARGGAAGSRRLGLLGWGRAF